MVVIEVLFRDIIQCELAGIFTMLKALIFDFDGIIVDTEPLHYRAFQEILGPLGLGYSWDDYVSCYMGFDDREAFREAFKAHHREINDNDLAFLISKKAEVFLKIIENGIKPYPGVVELIRSLSGEIPLALCSGALTSDIEPILSSLEIRDKFDVVVTAEDVAASKPDPASYVLAYEKLCSLYPNMMIKPENCLAIEDTPAGIVSAKAAGITVLAVSNSFAEEKLTDAVHVVDSLENITLQRLSEILS
jgi:beta-phosphoglucomutase